MHELVASAGHTVALQVGTHFQTGALTAEVVADCLLTE